MELILISQYETEKESDNPKTRYFILMVLTLIFFFYLNRPPQQHAAELPPGIFLFLTAFPAGFNRDLYIAGPHWAVWFHNIILPTPISSHQPEESVIFYG